MRAFWIALAILCGVFLAFILFEIARKKLLKVVKSKKEQHKSKKNAKLEARKEKKLSKKIKQTKKEPTEENKIDSEKISLKSRIDKKPLEKVDAQIEDFEVFEDEQKEYSPLPSFQPRRRMPFPPQAIPDFKKELLSLDEFKGKKSIKDQINELSPEMKAILISNILGKKEDDNK